MPFILSSPAAAPTPPASPGNRAPTRSSDQDPSQPGSFGDAMARSREASQEKAAEPAVRPAPSKPVRRPADAEKAPVQDSINPMAALLIPLESRLAATAMPVGAAAGAGAAAAAAAAAAGPAENPGIPDASLSGLLAAAPAPAAPGGLAGASDIVVDTDVQAALASGLVATARKGADLAPVQVRETPASHGLPIAADPRAVTAQADAASAGLPDPSSGQGDDGLESAPLPALVGLAERSPEAADTTPFAGTGPLAAPAGAALQQPGGLAAPNAPTPVASALLVPDVGSSEWGKALGQQVIHLSATDRQVAELQLNPPGLGPLKVTLSMSDQQMQAAFVSAHSSVRAAVEAALPQLRALLAESGISLGQTSVGAESQSQTAFANGQGDSGNASPRSSYRGREADKAALLFSAQPAAAQRSAGQGLRIDIYA